jgi:hypothetical protein
MGYIYTWQLAIEVFDLEILYGGDYLANYSWMTTIGQASWSGMCMQLT